MKKAHNFREPRIWKDSIAMTKEVYNLTALLPYEEKFGLSQQMRRSAVSIPSNISEGSGRSTEKDFLHFLRIAMSSSYELETQLFLCKELYDLTTDEELRSITILQKQIGAFIKLLTDRSTLEVLKS